MKTWMIPAMMALGLSACASYNLTDSQRLAMYQEHSGEPVQRVNYTTPVGWDRVDDQHVALDLRPGQRWLLTLSGPCLRFNRSGNALRVSPSGGIVLSRFDMVEVVGSTLSCRIEEIRPVDLSALRAAEQRLREQR
ncbi:DUF6491 family protein [Thermomonas sp.]|uniref:DUF6491 family protein n=1 Tax=Thermomonas sp. TaxID=1971895 RepID=UPI00261E1AD5|nr:DUF6491 family protein [Thermomonas sp.]MCO5054369.1 DUF6491 family protein [Thermomonas sp.]